MTTAGMRPSWGGIADAIGHCVLVFAFLPVLAPVPSWIAFEVSNPLNARDPVVLSFVLVRGVNLLLDTFRARAAIGVLSGAVAGITMSAWVWTGRGLATTAARIGLGAVSGIVGTVGAFIVQLGIQAFGGAERAAWSTTAVMYEMLFGLLCGMIAAPTALRLSSPSAFAASVPARARLHPG